MISSIIATLTSLTVILINNAIRRNDETVERKHNAKTIFRLYSEPLALASTSLLWRLNEILLEEGRGTFLVVSGKRTSFQEYKWLSTLYRLAALLAWIRAFRRENSILTPNPDKQFTELEKALNQLERALADGKHVELVRLEQLCDLWNITLPKDSYIIVNLAACIDSCIYQYLSTVEANSVDHLSDDKKQELCRTIMREICGYLHREEVSNGILEETFARASQFLSLKQAWLYRDWQSGIGDLLIVDSGKGSRLFDVIGYYQFERLFSSDDDNLKNWLDRLENIFRDLDVSIDNPHDMRVTQLCNTLQAVAELILVLSTSRLLRGGISSPTEQLARKIAIERKP